MDLGSVVASVSDIVAPVVQPVADWLGITGSIITLQNLVSTVAIYAIVELLKKVRISWKGTKFAVTTERLLPVLPVLFGILISFMGGFSLGTLAPTIINKVMFGVFAGSSASIVYKIWHTTLKKKVDEKSEDTKEEE